MNESSGGGGSSGKLEEWSGVESGKQDPPLDGRAPA